MGAAQGQGGSGKNTSHRALSGPRQVLSVPAALLTWFLGMLSLFKTASLVGKSPRFMKAKSQLIELFEGVLAKK